jgi:hypothetical protein
MTNPLEYHISVRHSLSASILALSLVFGPAFLIKTSHAQINGAPASVTSQGFGGHSINGTPSSVTSLGPRGFSPQHSGVTFSSSSRSQVSNRHDPPRHGRHFSEFNTPLLYAYPVPYAVDEGATQDYSDESDTEYQGGPTILDRRGSGESSYVPPVKDDNSSYTRDRTPAAPADPAPAGDPTLLVFRDGHTLEVGNYAIVGSTLFDLTLGHSRKVPLSDLDLEATRKQNDDRGVIFQLPASLQQAN